MLIVLICIGSSCHLKGSHEIVEKMQEYIEKYHLENNVALSGSFCTGKCNREGVTIQVNDEIYTGITMANFDIFFEEHILQMVEKEV